MPLWPLPPILALVSLGYIFTKQTSLLLYVTLITIGIGLLYWAVVILPQRGTAWNLRHAALDEDADRPAIAADASAVTADGPATTGDA
jgi:hypothetical protein